jgi:hypothetical protein
MLPYAPGARVVIRDEEWLVRRVDPSSDGVQQRQESADLVSLSTFSATELLESL